MSMFKTITRLLTFSLTGEDMLQLNRKHFIAGLIGTWVVGMGRYWDDKGASLVQHLGLGSLIYIFLLAGFIWLIVLPFKVDRWEYFTVVTFIGLTSFPAILYAIPVERFLSYRGANTLNVWFLAIVAIWRLCLLYYFLKCFTQLSIWNVLTITLMPVCLIISILTALNLHRVVFDIMSGNTRHSPHDDSYLVLMILTIVSMILTLPLLIAYFYGIYKRHKKLV